jgi:hypothetical protein
MTKKACGQSPYAAVEKWLYEYTIWKHKIENLRIQLTHISGLTRQYEQVAIHGQGNKSENVYRDVLHRQQITELELPYFEIRVQVLDNSLTALTPEERTLIECKYMKKLANTLTMDRLGLSRRTFFYKKKELLQKIYELLGGDESLLWQSLDELIKIQE